MATCSQASKICAKPGMGVRASVRVPGVNEVVNAGLPAHEKIAGRIATGHRPGRDGRIWGLSRSPDIQTPGTPTPGAGRG